MKNVPISFQIQNLETGDVSKKINIRTWRNGIYELGLKDPRKNTRKLKDLVGESNKYLIVITNESNGEEDELFINWK